MIELFNIDVLVVEDEPILRDLFVRALRAHFADITIEEAGDGAQAVAKMQAGCSPRLILTNIMMPNMNGEALLNWVRTERPGIPVIAVSMDPTNADFDDYMEKPFELADFLACISRWLPDLKFEDVDPQMLSLVVV